ISLRGSDQALYTGKGDAVADEAKDRPGRILTATQVRVGEMARPDLIFAARKAAARCVRGAGYLTIGCIRLSGVKRRSTRCVYMLVENRVDPVQGQIVAAISRATRVGCRLPVSPAGEGVGDGVVGGVRNRARIDHVAGSDTSDLVAGPVLACGVKWVVAGIGGIHSCLLART